MLNVQEYSFEELYALKEFDAFFTKVKEKCEIKLRGKTFAGMEKEDVVQEVLIKVSNALGQYDAKKSQMSTYIDHIINNKIKDCYRKAVSYKNLCVVNALSISESIHEPEYGEDDGYEDRNYIQLGCEDVGYENTDVLIDIMSNMGLSEREKEIFRLRSNGYEFVEIAKIMGVSKARISQIWAGVKRKYEAL